jgi:MFS family permease
VIEGEARLQKLNAFRSLAFSSGFAFGPAIGGLVYLMSGSSGAFAVDALTFLISAALIVHLPIPKVVRESKPSSLRALAGDVAEGWRAFWQIRWYWRVASEFAVLNALVFAPYFVIGPHVAEESLGGVAAWAAILVALGVGEVLGALAVLVWEPKKPLLTAISLVSLWVLPLLMLAWVSSIALLAVGALVAGAAIALFDALWETAKQTHTPPQLRARLGSFDHLGSLALVPFGYILSATLLGAIGAETTLMAAAAILAVGTLTLAVDPSIRKFRRLDGVLGDTSVPDPSGSKFTVVRVIRTSERRHGRSAPLRAEISIGDPRKGPKMERVLASATADPGGADR